MTDLNEIPFELRTETVVRAHYHQRYPLLRAYDEVTIECNGSDRSINEPLEGGLTTLEVTRRALERIGKPARDRDDVRHAESYVHKLQELMRQECPQAPPSLADAIIAAEFSVAGCVTRAEDFEASTPQDRWEHVEFLVEEMGEDGLARHLKEALLIALPTLFRQITADDQERRAEGPDGWTCGPDDLFPGMTTDEREAATLYEAQVSGIEACFDGVSPTLGRGERHTLSGLRELRDYLDAWWRRLDSLDAARSGASSSTAAFRRFLSEQFDAFFRCRLWLLLKIANEHEVTVPAYHGDYGEVATSNHVIGFHCFRWSDLSE